MGEHCRVYWGSHGCKLERGHQGAHLCECCPDPEGHAVYGEEHLGEPDVVCVGAPPYYGPDTRFYGEDAPPEKLPA